LKEDLYAVLEWEDGVDDVASIICENQKKEFAEVFVRIAPPHLYREIRLMSEINNKR
jgi:hypothetical protein